MNKAARLTISTIILVLGFFMSLIFLYPGHDMPPRWCFYLLAAGTLFATVTGAISFYIGDDE